MLSIDFSSRDSLLKANSALITQLQTRLKAKRFRPQDGDNCKLGYIRALVQALQCQNTILKDSELDEIKDRICQLEEVANAKR